MYIVVPPIAFKVKIWLKVLWGAVLLVLGAITTMAFLRRKVTPWVLTTICLLFGLAAWATPLMPNGKCIVTPEFALAGVRIGDSVEKMYNYVNCFSLQHTV